VDGPLPDNVTFKRVPAFAQGEWPWDHHFGRGLMSVLEALEDDVVCLLLPDHWISCDVDAKGVQLLERFMRESGRVLRGNITAGTCLDQHGKVIKKYKRHSIVSVSPHDHHCSFGGGLTFCPSLWNREMLLRVLEPGWGLWDCERVGTEKFARTMWRNGCVSAGVFPAPVHRCHGLSHAAPRTVNLSGLSGEDRTVVRAYLPGGWDVIE
jgi:hypothetical protein